MAQCPVCNHNLAIPFLLNLQGWSRFVCDDCGARLERTAPRSAKLIPFLSIPVIAARVFVVDHHNHRLEIIAVGFYLAVAALLIVESMHPKLRLRDSLPGPEIRLNLDYRAD
jgi:hypothetical protein